ncbi:MAG: hypothetical protein B7X04_03840 [Parcubacteria group bacterium 21-54-25]|nr:MAG: hypothetical protein B7X04_03840 [Parcubacteria group bacterium 21-54-25]HQU08191.1 phospholipase D-like domain-containing protein [Candidatus Paceibacterota bacterium]
MARSARVKLLAVAALALVAGYLLGAQVAAHAPAAGTSTASAFPAPGSVRVLYSLDKKQNDQALISLIDNAHQYVYFAIYEFTLQDVADALARAKARGVDVRGIIDRKNSTTSYEQGVIHTLEAAGIPIETQTHPTGIMHVKALVTESAYASGSYNWTNSATNINDEVLEIGTDPTLRARYEAILKQLLATNAGGMLDQTSAAQSAALAAAAPTGTITYTDAAKHVGQTASVSGTIVSVYTSKTGTTFFDYCVSYNGCPFSAVIFASDKSKFGSLTKYQGQRITVSGPITSYQGRAEIVLNDPSQISK